MAAMSASTLDRQPSRSPHHGPGRRSLTPLLAVTAAALVFTILLVLVRLQWRPLESVDHGAAARAQRAHRRARRPGLGGEGSSLGWAATACCGRSSGSRRSSWPSGAAGGWWRTSWSPARARWSWTRSSRTWSAGSARWWPTPSRTAAGTASPAVTRSGRSSVTAQSTWSSSPAVRGRWRTVFTAVTVTLIALIGVGRILLGVRTCRRARRLDAGRHLARPDRVRVRTDPPRGRPARHRPPGRGTGARGPHRSRTSPAGGP